MFFAISIDTHNLAFLSDILMREKIISFFVYYISLDYNDLFSKLL